MCSALPGSDICFPVVTHTKSPELNVNDLNNNSPHYLSVQILRKELNFNIQLASISWWTLGHKVCPKFFLPCS